MCEERRKSASLGMSMSPPAGTVTLAAWQAAILQVGDNRWYRQSIIGILSVVGLGWYLLESIADQVA
jgi:hypothetical protein